MKKWLLIMMMSALSTSVFASGLRCGFFNISVRNNTGHDCTLRTLSVFSGSIVNDTTPRYIRNNEVVSGISVQQDTFSGPYVQMEFQCGDNKTISLSSQQNLCFLEAGDINGHYNGSANIHASYTSIEGSFWYGRPGSIFWALH